MKTQRLLILALFSTLLGFATLGASSSSSPSTKPNDDEQTNITYTLGDVKTDSTTSCNTTRYLSSYTLYFDIDLDATKSMTHFEFIMEVSAPGTLCNDSTPMTFEALDSKGNILKGAVNEMFGSPRSDHSDIMLSVNLLADQALEGGICIVVETIDPPSTRQASIIKVDDWMICNMDDCTDEKGTEVNTIRPVKIPAPESPSCEACQPPHSEAEQG